LSQKNPPHTVQKKSKILVFFAADIT